MQLASGVSTDIAPYIQHVPQLAVVPRTGTCMVPKLRHWFIHFVFFTLSFSLSPLQSQLLPELAAFELQGCVHNYEHLSISKLFSSC